MELQAKPDAAIWNKDLLEMSTFVPVMLGSLLVFFSWRESEEVLMSEGKSCFFKSNLALCYVDTVRSSVATSRTCRICLMLPIYIYMLMITVVKNPEWPGHSDLGLNLPLTLASYRISCCTALMTFYPQFF